ncbi:diguanylate cyclase [Pseudoalteromonas sp. MMG024]|uniref:GGDEF domain-containing response regulator n=1 Tax=Pseudoalteromonas sp. MMG024 TaxID=2909980 RepID=UPI001EFFD5F5|nr:diguanylate cyclase [Pseudoalteromonas sp. MMG024]MCF6456899.1 diguanylate cyclase [Pseudoalteromonas sp. MMG024]
MQRILIVEDSKMVQQVLRHLVAQYLSVPVDFAASLRESAGLMKNNKYTLALVDLNLPDASNGEVATLTLRCGIPTLVLTGSIDEFKRQQMLEMGVVDYVLKENRDSYIYAVKQLAQLLGNQGTKVLVADDSQTSRTMMRQNLERLLYHVEEAEDGEQAYQKLLADESIKLLLTDYAMPKKDGFELVKSIRSKRGRDSLGIIGISGSGSQSLSAKFIKHGANDFLTKPFAPEEFHCRVMMTMEQLNLIETIKDSANKDYLTGLYNRRYFYKASEKIITEQSLLSIAVIDIDHFKQINDTYGHQAGDEVLSFLSNKLTEQFGDALMARLGGEEFAVLFSGEDQDAAFEKLDELRFSLTNMQVEAAGQFISLSISAGVAQLQQDEELSELINRADVALYDAKGGGRNQVVIHQ